MSLTVTLPPTYDGPSLRREVMAAVPALNNDLIYDVVGDQLTIEHLDETHRAAVEGAIVAHTERLTERAAVMTGYAANLAFIANPAPTNAEAIAAIKAHARQINYLAKALFDAGII